MAVDMFLKIDGAKGESKDRKKKDEIDVLAWSWGGSQSGSMHIGGGGGSGKASFQDLSITKYIDMASAPILEHLSIGKHFPEAVLTVRKAGGKQLEYLIITLNEVLITSYSTGGSGGEDRLTENLTMNFAKIKIEYKEQTEKGDKGKDNDFTYNIRENASD